MSTDILILFDIYHQQITISNWLENLNFENLSSVKNYRRYVR